MDGKLELIKEGEVRTRFAPSPTGNLHIGSARTALFNYLFARKNKGKFILRIEDTDKERSLKKFEEDILNNLKWLGLKEDEFYRQSERVSLYENHIKKLLKENKAYYCFCSKEELEDMRQEQMSRGEAPKYNGKCSSLSPEEVEKNLKAGKEYVIRFRTPEKKIVFKDLVRGEVEFDTGLLGDIAIAKDEKSPLYNLAVVIDDHEMKISHVIRGEDLLPNTPKQILIQEALDLNKVNYAHLPLILGKDKSKMSKRDGATSIKEYTEEGYLVEALINFLAFLGWNPGDEREIFSLSSLVKEFSLDKVQKSGAVFNIEKLDHLNGFYIRNKSLEKIAEMCLPYLISEGLIEPILEGEQYPPAYGGITITSKYKVDGKEMSFKEIEKIIALYQERLKKISEIGELVDFFFKEIDYDKELLRWKEMSDEEIKASIDKSINILSKIKTWDKEKIEKELLEEAGKNRGELLWPLRVALTGKKASASPFEVAEVLGQEKTLKRLNQALLKL